MASKRTTLVRTALFAVALSTLSIAIADEPAPRHRTLNFTDGADQWAPTDPAAWKIVEKDGKKVFSQFATSKYKPPHRSPLNIALLKDETFGSFQLTASAQSTIKDYPHRDLCLFFGYQDPAHFYYVHLGKSTDDHANQIFIVNGKDRTKISTKTTAGTPWDDAWHKLRVVRDIESGKIEIFYDDLEHPVMTASDKTFAWGQVGIGSFDDTGNWESVEIVGDPIEKPAAKPAPGDTKD